MAIISSSPRVPCGWKKTLGPCCCTSFSMKILIWCNSSTWMFPSVLFLKHGLWLSIHLWQYAGNIKKWRLSLRQYKRQALGEILKTHTTASDYSWKCLQLFSLRYPKSWNIYWSSIFSVSQFTSGAGKYSFSLQSVVEKMKTLSQQRPVFSMLVGVDRWVLMN